MQRHFRARFLLDGTGNSRYWANSRPFEGLLVCVPAVAALGWRLSARAPSAALPTGSPLPARGSALLFATVAFLGYYDYRVFGNPFTLPYQVNRATYAATPYFL